MAIADAPQLTPRAFDVHLLIDEIAARFAGPALAKDLSLEVRIAPNVPLRAIGEATWLQQVMVSLIDNAIRFTDRGEVVASVTCDDAGTRALLHAEVSDTGCGMPPQLVDDLFGPSAGRSAADGAAGTLHVAARLVELMDGQLGASSALGVGTTTWFTVPLDLPRHDLP